MVRSILWVVASVFALMSTTSAIGKTLDRQDEAYHDFGGLVMVVWADGRTPRLYSLDEFELGFGGAEPGDENSISGESGEDIIPTPGPPGGDSGWEPGDQVTYNREAMYEGVNYGRITVYERTHFGDWFRVRNDFRRIPGGSQCQSPPCPPQFPF